MKLDALKCTPCQGGIPPLTKEQAHQFLKQVDGWQLVENDAKLKKQFKFPDFLSALSYVNKVGQLCEQEGHHADISFGWGYVDVYFYTHKINGLHENDFVMAAKVDRLIS